MSARLTHGSPQWFEMVGTLMCEAAARAGLPHDFALSLVERYTDGAGWRDGTLQGLRFDISAGIPAFRVGVLPDETGDITVELTAAASLELNGLRSADPRYRAALARLHAEGAMRIEGDPARLDDWFAAVHDPIVERTV